MKNALLAAVLLSMSGIASADDYCKYSKDIERSFNLGKLNELAIQAGAGSLKIIGDDKTDMATIDARACASSEKMLEQLEVVYDSDDAAIKTQIPSGKSWLRNDYASIDLEIVLPSRLELIVQDSSGKAEVRGVASLNMQDSSGELSIASIDGDVNVVDSSGALEINKVKGEVSVTDSSGGIEVADIDGNFTVLVDSSGAIEAKRVAKDVLINVDSSGGIEVDDVGGDFTVGQDGSGGIKHNNVRGKVSLPR